MSSLGIIYERKFIYRLCWLTVTLETFEIFALQGVLRDRVSIDISVFDSGLSASDPERLDIAGREAHTRALHVRHVSV